MNKALKQATGASPGDAALPLGGKYPWEAPCVDNMAVDSSSTSGGLLSPCGDVLSAMALQRLTEVKTYALLLALIIPNACCITNVFKISLGSHNTLNSPLLRTHAYRHMHLESYAYLHHRRI